MTDRLYYTDACLLDFEAEIVETGQSADGCYTVLNRSAFYPTSGGQLCDHGTLGGIAVKNVIESDQGEVWHISDEPVGQAGQTVHGAVDRQRRTRNRQLHTAQHIISQVFVTQYGWKTVSVHLGEEYGAVELDTDVITDGQLDAAEVRSNQIVADDFEVEVMFVESAKAAELPLRKDPRREGEIRIIRIDDLDWSACGGTHCDRTSGVGLIKFTGIEKMRGHVLVTFLVGDQAREDYRARYDVTDGLSRRFTCHFRDLMGRIDKLENENKILRHEISAMQKELLPTRAASIAESAETHGGHKLVARNLSHIDPSFASSLAGEVAGRIDGVATFCLDDRLVLAVSEKSGLHAGKLMKQLCLEVGVKGGGGPLAAQAGGADCSRMEEYKRALIGLLSSE